MRPPQMLLLALIKVDHEYILFSKLNLSQIYFELASISTNRRTQFRGFTVPYHLPRFNIMMLYYHERQC